MIRTSVQAIHDRHLIWKETCLSLSKERVNPMEIDCDPYTDSNCETIPPREFVELGNTVVCGVQYIFPWSSRLCPTKHKLQSYPSWESAEADGAIVTHVGGEY